MSYPRSSIRFVRYAVQIAFLLITVYAGWEFHQFVLHFEEPGRPFVPRPPSVDAYLPIGALMAFKYFVVTGTVDDVLGLSVLMDMAALHRMMREGDVASGALLLMERAMRDPDQRGAS